MLKSSEWSNVGGDNSFTTKTAFGTFNNITQTFTNLNEPNLTYNVVRSSYNDKYLFLGRFNSTRVSLTNVGMINVFERVNGVYQYHSTIDMPVPKQTSYFAWSLTITEDLTLIVGALNEPNGALTNVGNVYVYRYNATTDEFEYSQTISKTSQLSNDQFGHIVSVSRDGLTLVVTLGGSFNYANIYKLVSNSYVFSQQISFSYSGRRNCKISEDGSTIIAVSISSAASDGFAVFKEIGGVWSLFSSRPTTILESVSGLEDRLMKVNVNGTISLVSNIHQRINIYSLNGGTVNYQYFESIGAPSVKIGYAYSSDITKDNKFIYVSNGSGFSGYPNGYIDIFKLDTDTNTYSRLPPSPIMVSDRPIEDMTLTNDNSSLIHQGTNTKKVIVRT